MCQINEESTETMECKCKQICCKMQYSGLNDAIDHLNCSMSDNILKVLDAICNSLEVYSCLPGTCLLERAKWVRDNIACYKHSLNTGEMYIVNMLIKELKAFLNNNKI